MKLSHTIIIKIIKNKNILNLKLISRVNNYESSDNDILLE